LVEEVQEEDISIARSYKEIINTKTSRVASWSPKKQAGEFAKLRKAVGAERLAAVLEWYVKNIKKAKSLKLPIAASPSQFRKRFDWIEDIMSRLVAKDVQVTPAAAELAKKITATNPWPKGKEQIPVVVQRSWNAYDEFKQRARSRLEVRDRNLLEMMTGIYRKSEGFVEHWFNEVCRSIKNWKEWSGDLEPFVFSPSHSRFRRMAISEATRCAGRSGEQLWDKLLGTLGYEN